MDALPWSLIAKVSTGLSLVAFMALAFVWLVKSKLDERERIIKAAKPEDRAELVSKALEFFEVDTAGLTRDQKYEIAVSQIHARAHRFHVSAVVLVMGMVLLAALAAYAISTPPDRRSGSSSAVNEHRLGPAVLSGDTDWNFPNDVVRLRGDITTNGHSLSILAARLHSDGARIGGWRSDAPGGADGKDGPDGVNGTGDGQAGADGAPGGDGEGGKPGRAQGAIVVDAREHEGSLAINASGQNGGRGGNGGAGGAGGRGAPGEASRPGMIDCASGPGRGGSGGQGGHGGNGGDGGVGGNAGRVRFKVREASDGAVQIVSTEGQGGRAGIGGRPGAAGAGGPEGELKGSCRSAGRQGAVGRSGIAGKEGSPGPGGAPAEIEIDTPKVRRKAKGTYILDSG